MTVTNANGHWIHYAYDTYGHIASVTPQLGPATSFEWSRLGILEQITLPGDPARVIAFDTDDLGLVRQITHPEATSESFAYDAMRHLTNRIDTAGRVTCLAYAPAGHLASVTRLLDDGESNVSVTVSMAYDNQFNTLVIRDPLGRVAEAYGLDLQDRPVTVTNLEGQVMGVNYGHDEGKASKKDRAQ